MSLLNDIRRVEVGYSGFYPHVVLDDIENVELVEDQIIDTGRWSIMHTAVFRSLDTEELVAVDYEEPATEMQEGGDFEWEAYEVEPVEVTRTEYRKKV